MIRWSSFCLVICTLIIALPPGLLGEETPHTLAADLKVPKFLAVGECDVYWGDDHLEWGASREAALYRIPRTGGEKQLITTTPYSGPGSGELVLRPPYLYWTVALSSHSYLHEADLNSGSTFRSSTPTQVTLIALDETNIYWVERGNSGISSIRTSTLPLPGSDHEEILRAQSFALALHGHNIYFSSSRGNGQYNISKINKSGNHDSISVLAIRDSAPISFRIHEDYIYWLEPASGSLYRMSTISGSPIQLASSLNDPHRIWIDGDYVYVTERALFVEGQGAIARINAQGGGAERIFSDLNGPTDLAIRDGILYWLERGANNEGTLRASGIKSCVRPFLTTPISGDRRIEEKYVSSVMDHSFGPDGYYSEDGKVVAFNGMVGLSEFGQNPGRPGYRQDCSGTSFSFSEMNYVGTTGGDTGSCSGSATDPAPTHYLEYDGHAGIDFAYGTGRPILAAAGGVLEVPAIDPINHGDPSPKEKYNTLRIVHEGGFETWYLHALEGSECLPFLGRMCSAGDPERPAPGSSTAVEPGDTIGLVGSTGAGGPHLHFEVRIDGKVVDPFGCSPQVWRDYPTNCSEKLWLSVVFSDDMETGDTSSWSATYP